MAVTYEGALTTTGNSKAIRFEKAFFQALGLNAQARITASILAPGKILLSVEGPEPDFEDEEAPYLSAFLGFLENSFLSTPEKRLVPITQEMANVANRFAEIVPDVSDDEELPDDVI